MKKIFISTFFIVFSIIQIFANPSDTIKIEKIKIDFSGFFRFDYWYDSRQVTDAVDGLFLLYPKKQDYDVNGQDLNASPSVNALAMGTRFRTNIKMPDIFNAKSILFVETDFTGISNMVNLRLRHAYAKFKWEKNSLLVGLTWHPLFVTEVFPNVASLNTGAPFQSFNRSPQVTFQQSIAKGLTLTLSAVNQSDSKSLGPLPSPNEASSSYLRNGLLPNLNAHLQFNGSNITIGVAVDYKSLRPRLFTTSLLIPTERYLTKERIESLTEMLYVKYQVGKLVLRAKGMYGQNLAEQLMLGGYGVSSLDSLTGKETYSPLNHAFVFGNVTYGKKYQVSLFVGYAKNLGAKSNYVSKSLIFARGSDIEFMYRISPSISYINNKFQLSAEFEYTTASYGDLDLLDKGKVKNGKLVSNSRMLFLLQYNF
ncbi:MAG: hypothetical protein AB9846_11000 [Tenuifilaceae bacterium]